MLPLQAEEMVPSGFDSTSDFGGVGLLQMPTARFAPEGTISFSSGRVEPYFRNALMIQGLPWAEGVLRYTTIQNRLYGPVEFSGDQKYKDRSVDLKIRLIEESANAPQVAIGFRDIAGTGIFSSEYLVMSRRYYDWDFTLGMGWGNMGSRGQVRNPFTFFSKRFEKRQIDVGEGGTLSYQYFRGPRASLFGGVSFKTPVPGLTAKIEYDGNNYRSEGLNNAQKVKSPFNFGLSYRYNDWLDISMGVERGNKMMVQLSFRGNLASRNGMPKLDPPPEPLKFRDFSRHRELLAVSPSSNHSTNGGLEEGSDKDKTPELRLATALEARKYQVDAVAINGKRVTVRASQNTYRSVPRAIGRAARIMANESPPEVEELTYINLENGLETSRITLLRKDLEKALRFEGSAEEIASNVRIESPGANTPLAGEYRPDSTPEFTWNWSPAMRHHVGGPDNPYFYQVFLRVNGELKLSRELSLTGDFGINIYNNFAALKLPSDSELPHVRSDIKEYLKQGKNGVTRLQLDYLKNFGPDWYGRASAGIFEDMFGGVGGELLYKPFGRDWAVGAELYRVRQRDFKMRFDFRDYKVTTGHVDLYYKLPFYQTLAKVSAGRYLAGDKGITVDLSRRFENGAMVGIFFTKTNVSAEQFGEGSFDKGFYFSIPIDMISLFSTRGEIGLGWRPLTRDGGQRLNIGKRLYPLIRDSGSEGLTRDWSEILK